MMAFALLLFLCSASVSLVHAVTTPPPIFVFGDSLADVGNNNNLPNGVRADHPHYGIDYPGGVATGRFSNGYNFIDILAQHMGFEESPPAAFSARTLPFDQYIKRGLNFASGGSGILIDCGDDEATAKCYSLTAQIKSFSSFVGSLTAELGVKGKKELLADSIFIISTGYSDVAHFLLDQLIKNPLFPTEKYIADMTSTFGRHLQELYSMGARKFGILHVPLGGVTPLARAVAVSSPNGFKVVATLNGYSLRIGATLSALVSTLSSIVLPEMKYSLFNTYAIDGDLFNHTAEHGWKNAGTPCCGQVQATNVYPYVEVVECTSESWLCDNRDEYVFWDSTNPTQTVVEYGGELFYNGNQLYAFPMNLKQLVKYGSSGTGANAGVKGRTATLATPNHVDMKARWVEYESLGGVAAGGEGRSAAI